MEYITSYEVKNIDVTDLFNSDISLPIDDLVRRLITMKRMILSVAHEILRNSNAGIILSFRNKLSNIQIINKIVKAKSGYNYLDFVTTH